MTKNNTFALASAWLTRIPAIASAAAVRHLRVRASSPKWCLNKPRANRPARTRITRNDGINRQFGEHFQRFTRTCQSVGLAEQFGENHAETVFPERIAGNQDALFRVVISQRFHVVTGHGEGLPVELAHFDFAAGADQMVVLKTGGLLAERREQQRVLIPIGNRRMQPGGDHDFAIECRLQGSIAADVVGVRVRIYQAF